MFLLGTYYSRIYILYSYVFIKFLVSICIPPKNPVLFRLGRKYFLKKYALNIFFFKSAVTNIHLFWAE